MDEPRPTSRVRAALASARQGLAAIFRREPYDTSTTAGRAKERYRRAALSTLTSALAQILGTFTGLFYIRISLGYLGKAQYGLWIAISALLMWAQLADFGLGKGVQNHLSEAYATDDQAAAGRYLSTGFFTLVGIATVLLVVALPLLWIVPWTQVLNVTDPALNSVTRIAVGAVAVVFLANFPLSLVPVIYSAYQRGYVANLFNIAGSLLSVGGLFLVTQLKLSMPWLIVSSGGITALMTLVNFFWIAKQMPWLRPRWTSASTKTLRLLAAVSVPMLLFQLGGLVINETQTIVIAHRLGLSEVTDFSVLMRVYALPAVVISMLDGPWIPAFREAHVRGDRDWLRTAFFRLTKIKMFISVLAVGGYLLFGNFAAGLLSGRAVAFGWPVWLGCGALLVIAIWNVSFNDLLIATNRLWPLVFGILGNGLVTVTLTYLFARRFGMLGVVIATPLYSLVVTAWLFPWICRDLLAKSKA